MPTRNQLQQYPAPKGGLYLILDPQHLGGRPPLEAARQALEAGVNWLQLRDKRPRGPEARALARALRDLVVAVGGVFIVNDDPHLARDVEAHGVHVGQEDLSPREVRRIVGEEAMVGWSTHDLEEARAALQEPVDYIGFGPIHASATRMVRPPLGPGPLEAVVREVGLPVVAIGGIRPEHVPALRRAGAFAVAVIQGVWGHPDPPAAIRAYQAAWEASPR